MKGISFITGVLISLFVLIMLGNPLNAQTEPEAPYIPEKLRNGFQLSVFSGVSYNVFSGVYVGGCPCDFLSNESSFNMPFGASLNIPVFSDLALYLRAGWQGTNTRFFVGRFDSLKSIQEQGNIGDELKLNYSMLHLDILVRLIGRLDGERVFFGPSIGLIREKNVRLTETEYRTGKTYLIDEGEIEGARTTRYSFIIGAEYAFIPFKNFYVIPSFQVDYSPQKISDIQPIRPIFYKFLVSMSFQLF